MHASSVRGAASPAIFPIVPVDVHSPACAGGKRDASDLFTQARCADLARRRRGRVRGLRGAFVREPDGARCRHLDPAPPRTCAGVPVRVPGRVCGSCAMTVNGRARWTCRSHVKDVAGDRRLVIEPLRNLPRIKDLVCDLAPFFDKWRRAGGRFEGAMTRHDPMPAVDPTTDERRAVDEGIECINCAVCYSACDVVGWRPDYLGPPRSIGHGHWSTTSGTPGRARFSMRWRTAAAAPSATRTEAAPSTARWDQPHRGHRRTEAPDLARMAAGRARVNEAAPFACRGGRT